MLQHGNKVRIDTSSCNVADCPNGHSSKHKEHNGELGTFHEDIRDHFSHPPECAVRKNLRFRPLCIVCHAKRPETWEERVQTHYMIVSFANGQENLFTPAEIEDLGSDYIQELVAEQIAMAGVFEAVPVTRQLINGVLSQW